MKQAVRAKLLKIKALRKKQLELLQQLELPLRDNIKLLDRVLKNEVSVEEYVSHSEHLELYLHEIKGGKNETNVMSRNDL